MGISGLLPALKAIQITKHLSEYSGKTVAVDAYVWLHKGVYSCATEIATGRSTHKYVDYAMHRVRLLRHHGIAPYVVFDGGPLPAKKSTEVERKQKREDNRQRGKAFLAQGKHTQARECFVKCIDVTPQMAYQFIKALRAESVSYVVAPYEADAQLAYLERMGIVDAILTEDSDLLVFGCQNVLFKLDPVASTVISISRKDFGAVTASSGDSNGISLLGWSDVQFRAMTILSGCDYLPSIPGIGLKTACTLLRKWKTAEQVIRAVGFEGKKAVPAFYWKQFQLAEKCFLHQRVYCPKVQRLVHLNDVGYDWNDEFDAYVGCDLDKSLAKQIAMGDADPATYLPMEDINEEFMPRALKPLAPRLASNSPPKSSKAKGKMRESNLPIIKPQSGGILNFFGPNAIIPPQAKQVALAKPKPNLTGKASGKRTLAEVMEQDMSRKKKPRQGYSPLRTTESKFFPLASASGVRRRHSDGAGVCEGSQLGRRDKENIGIPTQAFDDDEDDSSELSLRVSFGGNGDDIMEFNLTEFPDAVEQEDGYISPSPTYSKETDDLPSPPPAKLSRSETASGMPPTGYIPSDEEDEDDNSFGADVVSSPVSVRRPLATFRTRIHSVETPTRASAASTRGVGNVLVGPTPTPGDRTAAYAEMDEIPSPTLYRGPDLRSMLDDDDIAEDELEEVLLDASAEISGSAPPSGSTSPSLSPETPVTDAGTPNDAVRVVIDVDDLDLDEEARMLRDAAERAKMVMEGWRERWALPKGKDGGKKGAGIPTAKKCGTKNQPVLLAGSRAVQLRRSETNVTPAGRYSLAKVPKSAPPKFNLLQDGNVSQSGHAPVLGSASKKMAGAKPRRSLTFESLQQTAGLNQGAKLPPGVTKKDRQAVDLTASDPLIEDEIVVVLPPKQRVKPRDTGPAEEKYDIFAQAQLSLSQFRFSR